ncbi:MAG: EAL domain-containing protein [Gallionella sp.]|nr:EAL domain-containing protein [Gallionella sp.]
MSLNFPDNTILALIKRFALIYLPIVAVLSIILLLSARNDEHRQLENRKNRESNEIKIFQARAKKNLEMVDSDLRLIARLPMLRSYLDTGSEEQREALADFFLVLVKEKRYYDKVRYLDNSGHEIIRIDNNNGDPVIVPREDLQDKSTRYYFHDTVKLNRGEIYVSPLDLNVEEGQIEIPHKPIIRLGTPVFDSAGSKKGIILFSYFGRDLLLDFRKTMPGGDHQSMLLSRDGYWLNSLNHADEWGFVLGNQQRTFGHDFADEWKTISGDEEGSLQTEKGLFTYGTIRPLFPGQRSSTGSEMTSGASLRTLSSDEYYWKIVAFTPKDVLSAAAFYNQTSNRHLLIFIYLSLALAAGLIALFTLGRKRSEAELRVAATAFASQQSLIILDANRVIMRVNKAFVDETGYTPEEVTGQKQHMLRSARHDEAFYTAMWACIDQTGSWQGEVWERRKNGEIYPKWLTITAVKGVDGSVTNYVGAHIDITERKADEEKIRDLAFYDPLTHLPNRRLLMDRVGQAVALTARNDRHGALLFIDLDNFKTLNDTLGHNVGDLLLQQVALRLESCMREGDTVARLGGDEFVVMLEDLSTEAIEAAEQTENYGEHILETLRQPYRLAGHEYNSTPSIGATLFGAHPLTTEDMFKQADIAMYQAKKAGRNTLRFFDPKMQESINSRAALEKALRDALETQQLQLYYQIQVDHTNHPTGAEALIRWISPQRGLVLPAHFIALAEETGMILPIGQWVLEAACVQLRAWQQHPDTRNLTLAVNVSARQFRQADFVSQVQAAVGRHSINAHLLKLELTESTLLENIEDTIATMSAIKALGVRLSLDDFGTGYSSLQYLKRLPLDQLKIDQSFVRDIATDDSDQAIVTTIIAMAHGLKLDVIAEGVETAEQRQYLLSAGCRHYQGYLFSEPIPIEQFEALLSSQIKG